MTDHKLNVEDSAGANAEIVGSAEFKEYIVKSEAGIFKNGKQYKEGETIELEVKTGERFVAAGDVKEGK